MLMLKMQQLFCEIPTFPASFLGLIEPIGRAELPVWGLESSMLRSAACHVILGFTTFLASCLPHGKDTTTAQTSTAEKL